MKSSGDSESPRSRPATERDDDARPVARDGSVYVILTLEGRAAERILEIQQKYDPRMAREWAPHVTIAGSSGMGPISPTVAVAELRTALGPIATEAQPLVLPFGAPTRFMQTNVVVLPLDPHGPLRELHERIRGSGLPYAHPRFAFTPHATLSFYPELSRSRAAEIMSVRIDDPAEMSRLEVHYMGRDRRGRKLLELPLGGNVVRNA